MNLPFTVYLDSNVISLIRNDAIRKSRIDIDFMYGFIEDSKNNENIIFPYSDAHLSDIVPSYKKGDCEFVERDLEFLSHISDNICICLYWNMQNPTFALRQPKEFFNEIINKNSNMIPSMEEFCNTLQGATGMSNVLLDMFKVIPSGICIENLSSAEQQYFEKNFPNTYKWNTFYNLMDDTINMLQRMVTDPSEYNELRKQFNDYFPLNKNIGNVRKNIISNINADLTKSPFGRNFDEWFLLNHKQYVKSDVCHTIVSKYMLLDFVGYASDTLSDKNKYNNLFNDARHCFYGAYCQLFITNDKRAYKKAKAIYEEESIGTKVMNTMEFYKSCQEISK